MQGHSTYTNYTSNHEVLNLLILQMKMSPLIVNRKEQGCCLAVFHCCYVAVDMCLLRHREVCGAAMIIWAFSFLPNLKNSIFFPCLFQHGTPPLLIAAGCGNIQMLQLLIKRGSRIDVQDKVIILFYCK